MGQYNPHAPYILGHEWVPIRNGFYVPDGVVERGYSFRIDHTVVPVSGAFYVEEIPGNKIASSCDFISVYPAGRETLSGPVKKLNIPASAISVNNPGSIDATAGVAALLNPEDTDNIIFTANTGIFSQLRVSFNTDAFAAILLNKRILDVRVRYQFTSLNLGNADNFTIDVKDTVSSTVTFPQATEMTGVFDISKVSTLSITEMNPFWDTTAIARGQRTILPWRFQELNRFRSGASPPLVVSVQNNAVDFDVFLGFMDLEVVYCEETRVLYGGFKTYDTSISNTPTLLTEFYNVGAIATRLYNPATFTQGNTLTPGDYVVTLYHRDMSSRSVLQGAPRVHAVRELYQLPQQRGIHVQQTLVEDAAFTSEDTSVLTHVTLHTSSSIVTGVHAYGTSVGAPVYGSRTAIQEIEDDPSTSGAYPQVRFYARRYGETSVPLTLTDVATGLSTVSITVADFDALPEIVDGWREVTLRFATAPTFPVTGDDVDWRWSATGELTGNQWQVLVSSGPTGSWNPTPSAAATGPATYWAPNGSAVALTWQSPTISGAALDTSSDAVLIFSQDPPAVTGFGVQTTTLAVTGATTSCATPICVPRAIYGNRLSWSAFGVCDGFERVETSSWGIADTGQSWTNTGGVAGNYNLDGHNASHTLTTANASRNSTVAASNADQRVEVYGVGISQVASGAVIAAGVLLRHVDTSNRYYVEVNANTDNTVSLVLRKQVAGTITDLATFTLPNTVHYVNAQYNVIGEIIGTSLRGRAWQTGATEPLLWQASVTDAALSAAGSTGLRSIVGAGNVNTVITYASFRSYYAGLVGCRIEIQRQDTVDATWNTIMESTTAGVCPIRFDDFEARVGVVSTYRARVVNTLDFAGPWVTGSGTIPAPGVVVSGDASSILIFTSNVDTSSSLAYVMQFSNQPAETFTFPEAETVSLQRLFGRDFFLAVRPLERGGEKFTRTILINNAAIPLPSLANFRDLRDLAWADLDYVCVRDELGNRWLATVVVPDGEVRGNRTIYLARIDVTEVTNTPTPVNP